MKTTETHYVIIQLNMRTTTLAPLTEPLISPHREVLCTVSW